MVTTDGALQQVIAIATPLCQAAAKKIKRRGPGRKPVIPDWFLAVMIVVAIAKGKKTKSAPFRFWTAHQELLNPIRGDWNFPSRSTFFDRYRRAWRVFEDAIELHTIRAIRYGWFDPQIVSVDKSVIPARGKRPRRRRRKQQRRVDPEASWTCDQYHG